LLVRIALVFASFTNRNRYERLAGGFADAEDQPSLGSDVPSRHRAPVTAAWLMPWGPWAIGFAPNRSHRNGTQSMTFVFL
jgi:hypothetical protein